MLTIKKIFTESVTISLWFFDCEACGILAPWPGIEPAPSVLEGEILTTRLLGKSQDAGFWTPRFN